MRIASSLLASLLLTISPGTLRAAEPTQTPAPPEAKPFNEQRNAAADVEAALAQAKIAHHDVILVFGANWCGDSRALAGWFATPRFQSMLDARYELVWIDVGQKDRNLDLARRFGLDGIKGTPTVLILDSAGKPRNLKDAPSWKNARSRNEQAIYDAFSDGMSETR